MTRPLCSILEGVSIERDVPLLRFALRLMADAITDPDRVEDTLHGLRRSTGMPVDEGTGMSFSTETFGGHLYSWWKPTIEFEIMISSGVPRPVRLRHRMPHRLTMLKNRGLMAAHLRRMADLIGAGVPLEDERSIRLHAQHDRLAQTCATLASIENIPGRRPATRLEAPSPFRRDDEHFGYLDGDALQPSRAFLALQRRRLPWMVQLSRNGTSDLFFNLRAVGTHVDAEPRSMPDVLRAAAELPPGTPPVIEWRRP